MKRYEFVYDGRSGKETEVFEFEDNVTEEEVQEQFTEWAWQYIAEYVFFEKIDE